MLLPREASARLLAPFLSPADFGTLYESFAAPFAGRLIEVRLTLTSDQPDVGTDHQFLCRTLAAGELVRDVATTVYVGTPQHGFLLVALLAGLDLTKVAHGTPDLAILQDALTSVSATQHLTRPDYRRLTFPNPEELVIRLDGTAPFLP